MLRKFLLPVTTALSLAACAPSFDSLVRDSTAKLAGTGSPGSRAASINKRQVPLYTYKVVKSWPHHRWAFTEGLVFKDGMLLESSGLYEKSRLLQVVPGSGQLVDQRSLPREQFAEGITVFRDRVYQLTLSGAGLIYDHRTLQQAGEFSFEGEGWGLTHDDTHLIMSDGSNVIKFLNPDNFRTEKTISVTCNNLPVDNLNALQYIKGEIYANVWKTDYIVRINPRSGEVSGWVNLKGLLRPEERDGNADDVLNGIAYDEQTDRLVVTGKRWPRYFEIRLEEMATS